MVRFFAFSVLALSFASISLAATVRTSNMNEDIIINQTLFNALQASAGTVPRVQTRGTTVELTSGNDVLSCSPDGCTLSWDTSSPTYPQDAAVFEGALYDALSNWAENGGKMDPAIHRVVYVQTGSVQITVSQGLGSNDQVECTLLNPATPTPYKECSLVVSDIASGTGSELQALYNDLLVGKTLIGVEIQALLSVVGSDVFSSPGKPNFYEAVHTLYTDLLEDALVVSANYAYVHPIKNDAGQVIADGIQLTLSGSQDGSGAYSTQQLQSQTYALAHRP